MSAPAAPIVTDGLTKHFGDVRALDGVDLEMRDGEVMGFLGPNGAGKTTTIRLLLDFLRPTRGTAAVLGGSPRDPEVRRHIGYLPAGLQLDPRYTGSDVFAFLGQLRGAPDGKWHAELLDRFELDPSRPIGELSTGNRRKIGIIQAFVHRPRLLVLDEPSSGLDPLLQHEFQLLVREAVADGASVFLSSHVLTEVERVADRVAILRRGALVDVADIASLRARARQRIGLEIAGDVDPNAFDGVPGVREVRVTDHFVEVVVEGSVDALLKAAARFPVERIVTHEAHLDDVFLEYYREDR